MKVGIIKINLNLALDRQKVRKSTIYREDLQEEYY